MTHHLHAITGGPGSGKTALIDALAEVGFRCMPEAGRAIIQDHVAIGSDALPWSNRAAFAEAMLGWEMRSHREGRDLAESVIFDRGVPDVIGYLTLCGLPIADHVRRAAETFRYNRRVFIAPYWPEIFAQDAERKQSAEEAEATCRAMERTYAELGYELVPLPLVSVAERVAFMRSNLG